MEARQGKTKKNMKEEEGKIASIRSDPLGQEWVVRSALASGD